MCHNSSSGAHLMSTCMTSTERHAERVEHADVDANAQRVASTRASLQPSQRCCTHVLEEVLPHEVVVRLLMLLGQAHVLVHTAETDGQQRQTEEAGGQFEALTPTSTLDCVPAMASRAPIVATAPSAPASVHAPARVHAPAISVARTHLKVTTLAKLTSPALWYSISLRYVTSGDPPVGRPAQLASGGRKGFGE